MENIHQKVIKITIKLKRYKAHSVNRD